MAQLKDTVITGNLNVTNTILTDSIKVTGSNKVYINGVGTYNGTNPISGTNDLATIIGGFTTNISGKEDVSNKVTTISSSSTDTQYPSAKCMYDLIGDIETVMDTIINGSNNS